MERGFTLIELMVVVAIVGVLAAIAIPNFVRFTCKVKQSEAKQQLKALYTAEMSYRASHDMFFGGDQTTLRQIGFGSVAGKSRYSYSVTTTPTGFTARATGKDRMSGDIWEMNHNKTLLNINDVCR